MVLQFAKCTEMFPPFPDRGVGVAWNRSPIFQFIHDYRPKKKDSCVQVSEVKKIRVGRSKNIFILEFFFYYTCTEVLIKDTVLEVSFFNQGAHCID